MDNKLFVGSLSYDTTNESLKAAFEPAGTVQEAVVITDRASGRSKGFGFVTMASADEAKKAVELLNGKEIDGRSVNVDIARPPKQF